MIDHFLKGEIVLYQSDSESTLLEVRIDEDTVWLTQAQMVELFSSTKQNISLHIKNIFSEEELDISSTVKEYLTVQNEGARKVRRKMAFYNLDVIISVGYRVKSKRGTQFRIWANKVLKDYLLKGYVISHRIEKIENKLLEHDKKFDLLIKTNLIPEEGIFYDGQIFDAYQFVSEIVRSATKSIILVDNYIDDRILTLFSKRKKDVIVTIYTAKISQKLKLDLELYNTQYPTIYIKIYTKSHDRFLIVDGQTVYHIGASLKDLGKKWFAFSKINLNVNEMMQKLGKKT
jgi:hypothetical protein